MSGADSRREDPFAGSGEIRRLAREIDWASTPLGPVERWSPALRGMVRNCLESPFPINLWCGPSLVLIYNDAYRHVLGAKHPGALGRPGSEVWAEIWPEIAPMFDQIRAGGAPVYADDAPFVIRRAGEEPDLDEARTPNAWFTFSLSGVRDEHGEIVGFLNVVAETTDRVLAERAREAARARAERAEERLREVFSHAPSFMAVLRGEGHVFEYVNEAYHQLVGYRDLLGLPLHEALPEVRSQGFERLLDEVLETGEPFVGREVLVLLSRTPGGEPEERFVDFVYYPITEADGTRSGVVAHGSDVTEHVLARKEAHRARAEAEQANQAKSQFLANMSHEIRTPINAIIGYTDLLELGIAGPLSERQSEQVERIRLSSQHLRGLVEEILDLAKAEAGRMEVAQVPAEASNAVVTALALVEPQAEQRGVALRRPCADSVDLAYVGDEDRVRQILVNLLSNAIKFTAPGGEVRITCATGVVPPHSSFSEDDGPFLYFEVEDTGIGIAPEQLEHVFQPFAQVESGHTRTSGGTGLGLTISRRLARLMGGDLTAESEPGVGSRFTLWLPTRADVPRPVEKMLGESPRGRPRGLARVGVTLRDSIDEILDAFSDRLRLDPMIPTAATLRSGTLEDHASGFLIDVAQCMIALGENGGDAADLIRDGTEIQRLISKLHGLQRARLGWSEAAVHREFAILRAVITEAVQRRVTAEGVDLAEAFDVLNRFLEQAEEISLRGWRRFESGRMG